MRAPKEGGAENLFLVYKVLGSSSGVIRTSDLGVLNWESELKGKNFQNSKHFTLVAIERKF